VAKKSDPSIAMFREKGAEPIYSALLSALRARVGSVNAVEDPKKTCVHITAGKGGPAYLGLHPRKGGVLLTVVSPKPIPSARVRKAEQVSANRCHCDLLLTDPGDVDEELLEWMDQAWRLVAKKA
jgi:hypothetical protein